jgi:hypothetical protein
MGDVQPVVAGQLRGGEQVADGHRGELQAVEVEPPVQVADPQLVGLPLVQRWGQRRADARADETDQESLRTSVHERPPVCTSW